MLKKIYLLIRAIPKTLYFNFKYLKFKDAYKLPILVSHRVRLVNMKGSVKIEKPIRLAMIRIGFFNPKLFDNKSLKSVWNVTGSVTFNGKASIGNGTILSVSGSLDIGDNFAISGATQIECKTHIKFHNNVLIGWDCLFMDGDAHKIYNLSDTSTRINKDREIIIGNNVWIGARCTIIKGVKITDNVIVAANSCVIGSHNISNCIIGGYPAKLLKENVIWKS